MELLKVALQIVLPRAARNDVGPLHYFKTSRIWKKKKPKNLVWLHTLTLNIL